MEFLRQNKKKELFIRLHICPINRQRRIRFSLQNKDEIRWFITRRKDNKILRYHEIKGQPIKTLRRNRSTNGIRSS